MRERKGNVSTIDHVDSDVGFDVSRFDEAIATHGVEMVHYRAMRCPVGLLDRDDVRRPHEDHEGCSNGFLYTCAGDITCLFTGNSKSTNPNDAGLMDGSTVSVTFPRTYDNSDACVMVAPFDRFFFRQEEVVVDTWQLFEHSRMTNDRLQFPAVFVWDLVDSAGKRYTSGVDFEVRGGNIFWIGNTPGINSETGKGRVCSVRYAYRPYYYVDRLIHEVRVASVFGADGDKHTSRMPISAVLSREYLFQKDDRDLASKSPTPQRQVPAPADGGFGPR